jgi:hypothetical protein
MIDTLPMMRVVPLPSGADPRPSRRDGQDFGHWLASDAPTGSPPPDEPEPREADAPPRIERSGPAPRAPIEGIEGMFREVTTHSAHGIASGMLVTLDFSLLPWRLRANAGLSYGGVVSLPCVAPGAPGATARPVVGVASPASGVAARVSTFGGWATGEPMAMASGAAGAAREAASAARATAVRAPDANRLSHLLWPHRVVRSQEGDDGLTVWIRDYRFDAADTQQLVASIRCDAQRQGLALHRIVLNGHELWRATHSPT